MPAFVAVLRLPRQLCASIEFIFSDCVGIWGAEGNWCPIARMPDPMISATGCSAAWLSLTEKFELSIVAHQHRCRMFSVRSRLEADMRAQRLIQLALS